MSWKSALKATARVAAEFCRPAFTPAKIDWAKVVTVDFETYFDQDYTLKKMSTSEYVRDKRFKIQMAGIKIGHRATKIYNGVEATKVLKKIDWTTHTLLCHNTAFDGFIMSHHMGIVPRYYYDTLSMARGLHSNEVDGDLDSVAKFYSGSGKVEGFLEQTKGVLNWPPTVFENGAIYCAQDVDETFRIFECMAPKFPQDEMDLVHITINMFCHPVLRVDIPRVQAEHAREVEKREKLFFGVIDPNHYDIGGKHYDKELHKKLIKGPDERELEGTERGMHIIKRLLGNNEFYADLLRAEGIDPPVKISKAWMKLGRDEREERADEKWAYAFAKDDLEFVSLPDNVDAWRGKLNPNLKRDIPKIAEKQDRIRNLIDARLAVKSTTNITRAARFIEAGRDGMKLPVGVSYARAHTLRWGGNNKMNMQNLVRGGELRASILADEGHVIGVCDSGQIEARVNAWLWGQNDLLDAFRAADTWDKDKGVARGKDRDAYCQFADGIYNFEVTTEHKVERFVGKTCVLGLGFQMGAPKLQMTLAKGQGGAPKVFMPLDQCQRVINLYRSKNHKIRDGWGICTRIIEDMAAGRTGAYKCLAWEKDTLWLPNGLSLKYPELRSSVNEETGWTEWSYLAGDHRSKIYGGLLCENIVQALARIIVAMQMLMMFRAGLRIVMMTHDEVVTHLKKKLADKHFALMMKCMKTAPAWCADIPLNAEGGYAENYSK